MQQYKPTGILPGHDIDTEEYTENEAPLMSFIQMSFNHLHQ